jgi:L-asparaginase II
MRARAVAGIMRRVETARDRTGAASYGRVEVHRGPYTESVHVYAACAVDADGRVLEAVGDIDRPYPIRSLVKPFVAAEFVRSGAAATFGFGDVKIAVSAGSHDGQAMHVTAVAAMLARLGLNEAAL